MAFSGPEQLTRRATALSSQILYNIDSATKDTLNASLAQTWVRELDESIEKTKLRIHDRIQSERPKFEQQLASARSIQTRYETLVANLNDLYDQKSDIFPMVVNTLTKHSALSQDAHDAETLYHALSYLLGCRKNYTFLTSFVETGQLPEAVEAVNRYEDLVAGLPFFLGQTRVAADMKRKLESTKARIQDQLSDAYSRCVVTSTTDLLIRSQVQVRLSETVIQIRALLHCLNPTSLTNHLSTLRRDLMNCFIDSVLGHPYSVVFQTLGNEVRLSLVPSSSHVEDARKRLDNLSAVLNFLHEHFVQHLPVHEASQFVRSLAQPIANSVLTVLLIPSLPSSFARLPSFLDLLKHSVSFEGNDINRLLESEKDDGPIKAWSDGISGHYERRRRVDILEETRKDILEVEDVNDTFQALGDSGPDTSLLSVMAVHDDDAWGLDESSTANPSGDDKNGWDFDDASSKNVVKRDIDSWGFNGPTLSEPSQEGTDYWGLNDDMDDEPRPEPVQAEETENNMKGEPEPDPSDAWGWNDDTDIETSDTTAWDDPWADSGEINSVVDKSIPVQSASQVINVVSPKAATKLEKLVSKNKQGHSSLFLSSSPPPIPEPSKQSLNPLSPNVEHQTQKSGKAAKKRPSEVTTSFVPKESYLVPKKTKRIIKMVETVIDESKLFYASNLFADKKDVVPTPGSILSQTASSILDLYQALYPIKHAKQLEEPDRGMLFSNSCMYMTGAIQRIEDTLYGQTVLKERLAACRHHLQVVGDSWFTETIERQEKAIDTLLSDSAQGFTYTADQDRYDECEAGVHNALQNIRLLAKCLKGILPKAKYYRAMGSIANAALSRILHDILALSDIPEVESHRLGELCRILNALEGLFSDETEASFVVVYVPNWLKFSYLSELLEASLADITYLFEQGALIDFQVEELVKLVRALFADSTLRASTINKILNGHPTP